MIMNAHRVTGAVEERPRACATAWTPAHIHALTVDARHTIAPIRASDVARVSDAIDIWDSWPVQTRDGAVASFEGRELWMALSAPYARDIQLRHHCARIRLLERDGRAWRDCGNLFADGFTPGSREWAGSAVYDPETQSVTVYFTAAGRRGGATSTFEQRLFQTTGRLARTHDGWTGREWRAPVECVRADDQWYVRVVQAEGKPGEIKAFRDPAYFRDPVDGAEYLFFTASLPQSTSAFNGAIGVARAARNGATGWTLQAPVITADRLNNELERPHVVVSGGLYYVFWSTQQCVFAPDGPQGPNGLYGMVAREVLGPYTPLNGSGLVAANPASEPFQSYSWWVLNTLDVVSFIDFWGLEGRDAASDPALARRHFGGTFAPRFSLRLDGARAEIVPSEIAAA